MSLVMPWGRVRAGSCKPKLYSHRAGSLRIFFFSWGEEGDERVSMVFVDSESHELCGDFDFVMCIFCVVKASVVLSGLFPDTSNKTKAIEDTFTIFSCIQI